MVTLAEIKTYLGISTTANDAFLVSQEAIVAAAIEGYCRRVFSSTEYVQRFYKEDYKSGEDSLSLFQYPLIEIDTIEEFTDDVLQEDITEFVRPHYPTSTLTNTEDYFFFHGEEVVVTYTAGYTTIPADVTGVLYSIIEERYNKKLSGISLNFGTDVQRISIPGTISVDFDYSLQSNERKIAWGTILGNHVNILDNHRSERSVIGSGKLAYVD